MSDDRDALVRSLWEEGKSDVESAAVIGCVPSTVYTTRKRLGLPCKTIHVVDTLRLRELWDQGKNDKEIARELHVSPTAICNNRRALGLDHQHRDNGRDWHVIKFTDKMGTKMTRALTPSQCKVMRKFLAALLNCANQRRPGERYNVSRFMHEYTGRSASVL